MSTRATMIDPERQMLGEVEMVGQDRWEEIHRRAGAGASIRAIARELDVDRKTVRRCLRQTEWKPYQRAARADTLLATHASYLRRRAADVGYSAQVLFQELGGRQYEGSYETVKRFVRPLREMQLYAAVTRTRFETPPGLQSQIDWGQVRVCLGAQRQVRHIFVLTLGYSRRSVYVPCLTEALGDLLDAHELAFTHFGGHTQEHLYDRPRTVCVPRGADGVRWNTTFKAFADFWGFEPRLCRAYRAQTKGKVESGVKYFKRNFLAGRRFRDDLDFNEQLAEWTATVADVRVHGTTHERPIDRFARERDALIPAPAGRAFRLEAPLTRVVATDYLVTVDTNRYSVPFTLIGQPVEVLRRDGFLQMRTAAKWLPRIRCSGGGTSSGSCPSTVRGRSPAMRACATRRAGARPRRFRSTSRSATSPATRRPTASGVRNDVAADGPPRRAPAAAAPEHGARACRSPTPGGVGKGALLCRLPRRTAERRGVSEDRQARHDADEPGPVPVHQGARQLQTSPTSPRSTASRSRS